MVKKPSIGLALGSGASRGLAHIGVLMALDENNVIPDYIAGCSIGALIGSLYLCGINLDLLTKLAKNMKADIWMDPAVSRKGILAGKKAEEFFRILTKDKKIEELKKPISIVATDLVNCKRYIFKEGPLWRAIRASISIPGIFCPVELGGMILVDGGVVERVPATLAKEMGADIVIAVDVGKGQINLKPNNLFEVIMQSIETMENTIIENNFSEDYIFINPIIKNINPLDFTKVDLCIEEGKKAALEALPKISKAIEDYCSSSINKGEVL
ncbi:MAG: patatin-like phospholipase family protein [Lutispora sp.]|nr:patatin-like phospholipase family protein [Lutispora sp.]